MSNTLMTRFAALHDPASPLILVNVWDAGSARAVAAAGAPAVATGSWAVAAAHGYDDGEQLPLELALANLARIVSAVDVPVSVDLESGYGDAPSDVAATVRSALDAGAVGANLEDGRGPDRRPVAQAAERLHAAREASGPRFWINARTDVFLQTPPDDHAGGIEEALERATAYAEAGADSLFAPGLTDVDLIRTLVAEAPLPITVMAADIAQVKKVNRIGVARVSMGPGPYLSAMNSMESLARTLATL